MSQEKHKSAERARKQIVEAFNQLGEAPTLSYFSTKQHTIQQNMREVECTFEEIMKLQQMLERAYKRIQKEQTSPK